MAPRDADIRSQRWRVVLLSSPLRGVSLNYEGPLGLRLGVGASGTPEGLPLPPFLPPRRLKAFLHLLLPSIPVPGSQGKFPGSLRTVSRANH